MTFKKNISYKDSFKFICKNEGEITFLISFCFKINAEHAFSIINSNVLALCPVELLSFVLFRAFYINFLLLKSDYKCLTMGVTMMRSESVI